MDQPESVRHGSGSAAAGARCKGIPRTALPDLNPDVVHVQSLHELNIRSSRKHRMALQKRPKPTCGGLRRFLHQDNTVRVADTDSAQTQIYLPQLHVLKDCIFLKDN